MITPAAPVATTRDEMPVFFEAAGEWLFGILTRPTVEPLGVAAIVLTAGGTALSTNRNRLSVRLCRRLAGLGYHSLRFDYHGVGESEGAVEGFRLDEPFDDDLIGAVNWIRHQRIERFVLIGSCFGARTALSCAPRVDGLAGLAMVSVPAVDFEMDEGLATRLAIKMSLWDYARRAARPRVIRGFFERERRHTYSKIARAKWQRITGGPRQRVSGAGPDSGVSPKFLEPLGALVRRELPILLIYGDEDEEWRDVCDARSGALNDVLAEGRSCVEILTLSGRVHGFAEVGVQDAVLAALFSWLHSRVSSSIRAGHRQM